MSRIAVWLVGLVGALHVLIGGFEVFGARTMAAEVGFTTDIAQAMAVVRNAGLYNLFLATVIFWALRPPNRPLIVLCLAFVVVAGIFGAITLKSPLVLALQTIPAAIALIALWRRPI